MPPLLQDAFDLARFRFKPLEHYAYDWWQPVVWLCLLCVLPAAGAGMPGMGLAEQIGLSLLVNWVFVLFYAIFFGWWLRRTPEGRNSMGDHSLFPLLVVSGSSALLVPLLPLLPPAVGLLLAMAIKVYQLVLSVRAMAAVSGNSVRHVVLGVLVSLPLGFVVGIVLALAMTTLGWRPDALLLQKAPAPAAGQSVSS